MTDPVLLVFGWVPLAVLRVLGADRCARWLNDRARRSQGVPWRSDD